MEKSSKLVGIFTVVLTFMLSRSQVDSIASCRPCLTNDSDGSPVCGSDRRTYSSRCLLHFARCKGLRVKMVHKGKCKDSRRIPLHENNMVPATSACLRDRQQALANARTKDLIMLAVFVPKCETDGSYSQVQCLNTSRYCWCVDRMGKEIEDTRVRLSQPRCPETHAQPSEKPTPQVWTKPCVNCKGCPTEVRSKFNERMVQFLSKEFIEYLQRTTSASLENTSGHDTMGKIHLLLWKFTHLDANADYLLEFSELQTFLRKTKKAIHPKKCSRTFLGYCDRDKDRKISLNEWHVCFGVKEMKKCIGEYLAAVKGSKHLPSSTQPYLPRCASDGSYSPTQCHYSIGYCWCVDVDSGKPISGTTTKANSLDCWQYALKNITTGTGKKECALNLWTAFKKQLLKLFRKEVEDDDFSGSLGNGSETSIRNQRRSARSGDLQIHGTFLSDNQVLIWKFNRLDVNKDKLLVADEFLTPATKKIVGRVKRGRKCSKKVLNDCDLDKDRGLSLMEWTHCLRTARMPIQ